jgi:hypothetical protein
MELITILIALLLDLAALSLYAKSANQTGKATDDEHRW